MTVDVGGGNFQPVVFDRVCKDYSDPICVTLTSSGTINTSASGFLKAFSALSSPTASLAAKGIVIVNGVPHGYISGGSTASFRVAERRPDGTNGRNVRLNNFAFTYYNAMVVKVTKATSKGFTFTGSWNWSKTLDTGSEATFTGTDVNAPVGALDPQRSLRALSSFNQFHRVVLSYSYAFPWMKDQHGVLGRVIGGWTISGVTTFASGLPFTVLAGYDSNMDGVGGDRPLMSDPAFLFRSVDNGRAQSPCPSALVPPGRCVDTLSQLQLPGTVFLPSQANLTGDQFPVAPGTNSVPGSIARNAFFQQGQKNFDFALSKSVHLYERVKVEMRMELYNAFNRVPFNIPTRTVNSTTPLSRITSTINLWNYVNSARTTGARMGQLAIRITY